MNLQAQVDTIYSMARFDANSLRVRWSCGSFDLMRLGLTRGWRVVIFDNTGLEVLSRDVFMQADESWRSSINTSGDSLVVEIVEEVRSGSTFFSEPEQLEWYRFAFLFGLQDNFPLSMKLGMATEFSELDTTTQYRVEVDIVGGGSYSKQAIPFAYRARSDLPKPEAGTFICNKNRVSMTGMMLNSAMAYSSFYLERKDYAGTEYKRINPLPLIVNYAYGDPMINFIDSIEKEGPVLYRLHGKDMWGEFGPYSDTVKLDPCHLSFLPPHPLLIRESDERGSIQLQWDIPDSLWHLLEGFNIYRAKDKFGTFELINPQILPPDVFEFVDDTPIKVAYYQVQAIYHGNIEKNSLTVLGTLLDLSPPAIPKNIRADLDTATMVVTVRWDPVKDLDLKGYRVSYAHGANDPKFLLNNVEVEQTVIRDTLGKDNLHQKHYYWVTTRDFSQNESFFSDSVLVEIPDRFPPIAPRITYVQSEASFVKIHYDSSPSEDVDAYFLQKRLKVNSIVDEWDEISIYPQGTQGVVIDSTLSSLDTFEYRVLARDTNGLTSYSNVRAGYLLDPILLPAFEYVKAEKKDTAIFIYFDYPDKHDPVEFRIMGGDSDIKMTTISRLDANSVILQKGVQKNQSKDLFTLYRCQLPGDTDFKYFKIRAISRRGKVSPYTEPFSLTE